MTEDRTAGQEHYLSSHPFERNVFIMMKYSSDEYHSKVEASLRRAFKVTGYFNPVFAKDLTPDYFPTLAAAIKGSIAACKYGIAVFTTHGTLDVNPNVAFELGVMWEQDKEFLILKDERLPTLFSDIIGRIYKEFSGRREDLQPDNNELFVAVADWLRAKERFVEDLLGVNFVTVIQNHVDTDPPKAIDLFEVEISKCVDVICRRSGLVTPPGMNLRARIFYLYRKYQLTTFIRQCMDASVKLCVRLRREATVTPRDKNLLLGHARVLRDIYTSWLRSSSEFEDLQSRGKVRRP